MPCRRALQWRPQEAIILLDDSLVSVDVAEDILLGVVIKARHEDARVAIEDVERAKWIRDEIGPDKV